MSRPIVRLLRLLGVCALCGLIAACGSRKGGGYYKDDGPGDNPPANLDRVPDAVPKIEPLARGPNRPYTALGKSFTPDTSGRPYRVQGRASWYGRKFHGKPTSSGERYDMYAMTAAHPTLPIPSYVRVTRVSTGKTVVLRVNDRGPFLAGRVIDLSYVAAYKLGVLAPGSAEVIVERIMPEEIRGWRAQAPTPSPVPPPAPVQAPAQTPAVAPVVAAVSRSTPAVGGVSFYLQAGAFSDPARAQSLVSELSGKVPADLGAGINIDQSTSNLYRVRIGPFANREAATQAGERLRSTTGLSTSIAAAP
ncbi:septal ring lytic transglycosylase RlpA family protein [Zwartia vadi]|uniref:septal ring lytic transglycosylase RlpA family protein n=1 Tax=Zwartia vadi TaxID=3058168 RepID=UPI0025B43D99|nr:septal ring lytic transglycosylase RlpA family protein [Zwartia vadi]MDN3987323.1 septal ring lytic transglycosylase RlpA family protein [Zwartia vadi]